MSHLNPTPMTRHKKGRLPKEPAWHVKNPWGYFTCYSVMKSRITDESTLTPGPMVEERAMLFT